MRERLRDAITYLQGRVISDSEQQQLAELAGRLANAADERTLNEIRNALAADFNLYGTGRELFGPQLGPTTAAAGTYRVTLTVGSQTYEGSITVRDDPMMAEHGNR